MAIAWFVGSISTFVAQFGYQKDAIYALSIGVGFSLLSFLIILFIEETLWAIKNRNA